MGLENLIKFLLDQINNLIPFKYIYSWQQGVRCRFGVVKAVIGPGLCWKIPYVHTVLSESVVDTTMTLPAQSIITADNKELIVKGSLGYKITDIGSYYMNVYDARSALADVSCKFIKEAVAERVLLNCTANRLDDHLKTKLSEYVKDYGIEINFICLIDITNSRSYRLFNITENVVNAM